MSDDNKAESVFDKLRRDTAAQQRALLESEQRRRDLNRVFRGGKHMETLLARFGLLDQRANERDNQ